jgi:RND family efflux transporter MFP subunit
MKFFITLIVVAGLGAGGLFFYKQNQGRAGAATTKSRPTTAVIEARDIRFEISAAGDIGPADQVSVRPEVNGRIEELPVDIGDQVKKGALLCRLDDKDLQIERSQRLSEIDGARLSLQKARRTFHRQEELFGKNLISQELYDDARTDYDLATNSLERAQQNLRLVDDRLRKTRIEAPFDCTVLTRPVSLGQTVSGSAGFNSGTEILTIANLNDMIVNAHVNQADVIRLKQGREVDIQAESVPGVRMKGVVERIAPQAVIKNGIKGFSARILIKDIDPRVRPGMTAVLGIPISAADNVLAVPLAAVFSENGDRFVFVKTEEKFERRPILIGLTDYAYAEVLKGLSAGEVVSLDQSMNSGTPKPPQPSGGSMSGSGSGRPRGESGVSGSPAGGSPGGGSGGGRREGGRREGGGSGGSRSAPRAGGS